MKGRFLLQVGCWQLWPARRGQAGDIFFRSALGAPWAVALGPVWDQGAIFEFFYCGFFEFLFEPLYIYKHFHSKTMYSGNNFVPVDFTWLCSCFGTESEQSFPFMSCTLLSISVCELKISLLLSLKFSIDREEIILSHKAHHLHFIF